VIGQLHVGVLFGGVGAEREISLRSGRAVVEALQSGGYRVTPIDVDRNIDVALRQARIDVAFLALHGPYGEDGRIQGMLQMMDIAHTGSGVLASALAMDKAKAKELFVCKHIPTPGFVECVNGAGNGGQVASAELARVWSAIGDGPAFVKPSRCGSSVGAARANSVSELGERLRQAFEHDDHALVEQCIEGKELTVGMLDGRVFGVLEVMPKHPFYDYTAKYTPGQTEYLHPPRVSETTLRAIHQFSTQAHHALGASSVTRADWMVNAAGEPFLLEVNTIPGLTPTSLVPRMYELMGKTYLELCQDILASALSP
jgi:D-alanine-D-alanine ligase